MDCNSKRGRTPNIGPKRSCRVYDDETLIIFNENTMEKSWKI